MRKDDSTGESPARARRGPRRHEPLRLWANLPITQERARELVDELTRHETDEGSDALLELICGLMPAPLSDDTRALDERRLAGLSALTHAFARTKRAGNELGAYVVGLGCAEWEWRE
jgi:hypothetical protein